VTELHLDSFGGGVPAVFVHGSFGWGLDTFPEQRALADSHRIVLVDRRGFGKSPQPASGWPTDMDDIAALMDELGGAHLVGQSYGAVASLLAAGLRPDRVLSLVAIEPPAFEAARGRRAADAAAAALKPVYERAPELTAAEFVAAWATAGGRSAEQAQSWSGTFDQDDWAAVEASRNERWPGDAPIDFDALASAPFPKVLVRGAWSAEVAPGREAEGEGYRAVCETIAERIGGRVLVFGSSAHNPQIQEPERFNALLREVWAGVESP
jgi:pimeloyl-ACP methyl ester carboxylesterase